MNTEAIIPAEFIKLRNALGNDLRDKTSARGDAHKIAEHLLSSGLVTIEAARARYDKASVPTPQPKWERGSDIEEGAEVEYVGNEEGLNMMSYRVGQRGKVLRLVGNTSAMVDCFTAPVLVANLQRIA